jgi:hypothetical protein
VWGMANRRRYQRRRFAAPVNICTETRKDRAGMAADLSAVGILFRSRSQFAVGDRVDLTFQVASKLKTATGHVVRTAVEPDYASVMPYVAAVAFDLPCLDLVELAA